MGKTTTMANFNEAFGAFIKQVTKDLNTMALEKLKGKYPNLSHNPRTKNYKAAKLPNTQGNICY